MTPTAAPAWLSTIPLEAALLRDVALLRHDDLSVLAADLVAVLAGVRTRRVAVEEFLRARQIALAARCIKEADDDERAVLDEMLRAAWGLEYKVWLARISEAREALSRGAREAPLSDDLQRALRDVAEQRDALQSRTAAWPRWDDAELCERLGGYSSAVSLEMQDQAELLSLALSDAAVAFERAERDRVDALKQLKSRGDELVLELTMRRDLPVGGREWVKTLAPVLYNALFDADLGRMRQVVNALEGLMRGDLPTESLDTETSAPRPSVPPPARDDARAHFEEASLSRIAQTEVIARLESSATPGSDAEGLWMKVVRAWSPEAMEALRPATRVLSRRDAIGAQVLLKARGALVVGDRERAYQFYLDALRWSLSDGVSALPLSRYQDSAAWGLLHAITLSVWAESWSAQRYDTESRDLHDALERVENLGLLVDVAEALLTLRHHGVVYLERWLRPMLVGRRAALRALVVGVVETFPQDPLWLWRLLVTLLKTDLPHLATGEDFALEVAAPRASRDFRAWRADRLDDLKARLQPIRDASGLADEAIAALERVAHRLERGQGEQEPGVALALLTPDVAASRRSRAVLRLTLNDERRAGIRGLRVDVRAELDAVAEREQRQIVPWLPKDVPVEIAVLVERETPGVVGLGVSLWEVAPDGARAHVATKVSNFTLTFVEPAPAGPNPYILKDAVHDASRVFGRSREIRTVLNTLCGAHQFNPVLVLGARRIGKTSFLNAVCAQDDLVRKFLIVRIDFQSVTSAETPEVFFLTRMMRGIQELLQRGGMLVPIRETALRENPHSAFAAFMEAVESRLLARDRRLLLVIDEMEKIAAATRRDERGDTRRIGEEVLASLRAAMQRARRVGFLLAGATDGVRRYQRTYHSRLFQLAEEIELQPLDDESARALIERQSAPYLAWRSSAVESVLRETAGDPSLIQLICFRVFGELIERRALSVTSFDVRCVVDELVKNPKDFWAFFESLDDAVDRTIVRVIANLQADPVRRERESARDRRWVRRSWITEELRRRDQPLEDGALLERLDRLCREVSNVLTRNPVQPQRDFRITAGLFAQHLVARPSP